MDAQRAIARRMIIGLPPGGTDPAWEKDFAAYPPAGVIVFRRDFVDLDGLRALTTRLRALARPRRIFIATDEEGGWVSQLGGHLVVPPNALLLGRGAEPGDIEWASRVTGERLRALGLDWVYAPVADVHSEPRNPVIGPRAYGTDPATVSARIGEALRGFRAAGLAACLKHFPGHGDTRTDSHLALPVSEKSREALESCEFAPFRDHPEAAAVMTAHVVYRALDPDHPATFSPAVTHDLLRDALRFPGVCVTDSLEMKGAREGRGPFEAARDALEAGCDLLLFALHDETLRRARLELARAIVDGRIARERFDASRPRLEAFDREHPEPTPAELERSLESLTPPGWEARLEAIVERGLLVTGAPPAPGVPWRLSDAAGGMEVPMREELREAGIPLGEGPGAVEVAVYAARKPLVGEALDRLRARCRERPTALIGLQNDSFLEEIPEAAFRLSAADSTPLTRRVVARTLARRLREAAGART
jgi:beta-N-acetylhexosaminidase